MKLAFFRSALANEVVIFLLLAVGGVAAGAAIGLLLALPREAGMTDASWRWLGTFFLLNAAVVGVPLALWRYVVKRPIAELGFRRDGALKQSGLGLICGLTISLIPFGLYVALGEVQVIETRLDTPSEVARRFAIFLLWGAGAQLASALSEELIFRALPLSVFRSVRPAIIIAVLAVLFAAMHIIQGRTYLGLLNHAVGAVALGFAFLWKRSIWPSVGLHAGFNLGIIAYNGSFPFGSLAKVEIMVTKNVEELLQMSVWFIAGLVILRLIGAEKLWK